MKRSLSSIIFKSADIRQPVTEENVAPANALSSDALSSDDGYTSGETSSSKRRKEGAYSPDFSSDRSSPFASTGPNSPNIFNTFRDSYTYIRPSIDQWKVLIDDAIKSSQVSQAAEEERVVATDKFSNVKDQIATEIQKMNIGTLDASQSSLINDIKSVFASELPSAKEQLQVINTILSHYCAAHSRCVGRLMKNNGSNNLNLTACHSENLGQGVPDIDRLCEDIDVSLTF